MKSSCLLVFAICILGPQPARGALIEVLPSTSDPDVHERLEISLQVGGLGDFIAPSLAAFDLDLTFDPTLLSFVSESYGDPVLGDQLGLFAPSLTFTTPSPGSLNLFQLSLDFPGDLDSLQLSSFTLLTLQFDTIAVGTTLLSVNVNSLSDAFGDPIDAETANAQLVIGTSQSVPEPSTATLLLFALGAYATALGRRREEMRKKAAVPDAR